MPKQHESAYKFFSLWFAWCFGIFIVMYLLALISGLLNAMEEQDTSAFISAFIIFFLKLILFTLITWIGVHLTCKSYILNLSDLLPILKYYWILGSIFIALMFIRLIILQTPVSIALIDLILNVLGFAVQSLIFYALMKKYAEEDK